MEHYDYRDWIEWPEADIREYACEIAAANSLNPSQANHLEREMTLEAGYWPERKERIGPYKMNSSSEALFRSLDNGDIEVFQCNQRMNRPHVRPRYNLEFQTETIGSGLTRKYFQKTVRV